jgi:hypothetical protein
MKMAPAFKESYPSLAKWIEENLLARVLSKPRVLKAFIKYSELSAWHALWAVSVGPVPVIHARVMPGANGEFEGGAAPDNVYLSTEICERFEKKDSKEARMHLLIESTLLHEMVHWGDWKDGVDQADEEGKNFEKEAYGQDINRYW